MRVDGFITQFLYLLVYTSSIICAAALIVFRKKLKQPAAGVVCRTAGSIAFGGAIISIQVFLNAAGILGRLTEISAYRITIVINILIAAVLGLLIYSAVQTSLTLRPAPWANRLKNITAVLISAMLLNLAILQVPALFMHSVQATDLLGISMIGGTALYIAGMVFSIVRLFIPLRTDSADGLIKGFRLMLLCLTLMPLLFIVSGGLIGSTLAPLGFSCLNIIGMRLLYLGIKTAAHSKSPTESEDVTPESNCRELGLSKRETEVALLLAAGRAYKEIADSLCISVSTTQTHVGRIYSKLGINSKSELSYLLYYKNNKPYDKK